MKENTLLLFIDTIKNNPNETNERLLQFWEDIVLNQEGWEEVRLDYWKSINRLDAFGAPIEPRGCVFGCGKGCGDHA